MADKSPRLIWIDCEMTGLDAQKDTILEIVAVVTESDLSLVATGPDLVIHVPQERLALMDAWNTQHHTQSGLYQQALRSTLSLREAESQILDFLKQHCKPGDSPLCGNSIHQDWIFLKEHMPTLEKFFHYRRIDVSTLKELAKRWHPELLQKFQKKSLHRALDDVLESIAELAHYRSTFLQLPS